MRVRILLQIATDDGLAGEIEELASLTKETDRPEEVGLLLAESKALLTAVQGRIVAAQAEAWIERIAAARLAADGCAPRAAIPSCSTRCSAMSIWRARGSIAAAARTRRARLPWRHSGTCSPTMSPRNGSISRRAGRRWCPTPQPPSSTLHRLDRSCV